MKNKFDLISFYWWIWRLYNVINWCKIFAYIRHLGEWYISILRMYVSIYNLSILFNLWARFPFRCRSIATAEKQERQALKGAHIRLVVGIVLRRWVLAVFSNFACYSLRLKNRDFSPRGEELLITRKWSRYPLRCEGVSQVIQSGPRLWVPAFGTVEGREGRSTSLSHSKSGINGTISWLRSGIGLLRALTWLRGWAGVCLSLPNTVTHLPLCPM